ncbi:MAG TPA: response regulator [Burkholderiaceae bacterium]|nr:response regulator [Burkholderiaceae bacterium]
MQDGKVRVLVVDRSKDFVNSLAMLLQLQGCDVRTGATAADALNELARFQPNVLILDSHLQDGADGLDVARRLCDQELAQRPLIIIMSAWATDQHRRAALAACADHFLPKPADPDAVVELAIAGRT